MRGNRAQVLLRSLVTPRVVTSVNCNCSLASSYINARRISITTVTESDGWQTSFRQLFVLDFDKGSRDTGFKCLLFFAFCALRSTLHFGILLVFSSSWPHVSYLKSHNKCTRTGLQYYYSSNLNRVISHKFCSWKERINNIECIRVISIFNNIHSYYCSNI
jgi:hypothetical protein